MRQNGGVERLEAALVEMGQGMTYPATPNFEPPVLAGLERVKGRWPRWVPYPRVLTPRLTLIIAISLALLAAAAAGAYYVSVQTWLSAGPRGVQFTNDFELVELFRDDDPRTVYQEMTIGPEGKEIYVIRFFGQEEAELSDPQETAIVRMSGLQEEQVQIEVVLRFSDLKDPALWHPHMDVPGIILPELVPPAAINGDLFLVASAWADTQLPEGAFRPEGPPAGSSIIVRHPDGMLQKVLTVRELVDAGLLDSAAPDLIFNRAVVASAPDRLWLQFITLERVEGQPTVVRRMIYEVRDPNGDGDWFDRTVTPLSLPAFVAEEQRPDCCPFMSLVAEPTLGGEDRSRSFLLLMSTPFPEREHRIYRVSDRNSDGDALDGGEFELLFSGVPASQDVDALVVAPRIVVKEGKVLLRELVISAFTTGTRVSRITETGELIDIARAFDFILDVVADSEGNIYVWAFPPDGGPGPALYKLKPVTEETSGEPEVPSQSDERVGQ